MLDKRIRSPNYPALSLKDAIEKVGMLHRNNQTHPAPREIVAKAIGYNSLNGASATAISALNKYGLLDGRGDDLKVSDRAMSILHPHSKQERIEALKAAAREPKLFAELAERFPGGVQSDDLLKNYLLRNGFATGAVTQAIQAYRETSDFVEQEAVGYDSSSATSKDDAIVNMPPPPNPPGHTGQASQRGGNPTEGTRVLQRLDLPEGGFVEVTVSSNVDALEAIDLLKLYLPVMEQAFAKMASRRKQSDASAPASRTEESRNE
jgi:hypothetical protein